MYVLQRLASEALELRQKAQLAKMEKAVVDQKKLITTTDASIDSQTVRGIGRDCLEL